MEQTKIKITIMRERPTGYVIQLEDGEAEMLIPKAAFTKRVEAGIYEVSNPNFLLRRI